jgi:type IV pilus assembly protein PilB
MDKYSKFLHENYDAIIARVKIISKLDIAERRKPQDGLMSNDLLRHVASS